MQVQEDARHKQGESNESEALRKRTCDRSMLRAKRASSSCVKLSFCSRADCSVAKGGSLLVAGCVFVFMFAYVSRSSECRGSPPHTKHSSNRKEEETKRLPASRTHFVVVGSIRSGDPGGGG